MGDKIRSINQSMRGFVVRGEDFGCGNTKEGECRKPGGEDFWKKSLE
jgi:hypothetical protein